MSVAQGARSLRAWFDEVLDADATARAALLAAAQAHDPELAAQLDRLLSQHERHLHSVTRQAAGALGDDESLRLPPVETVGPWRLGEELGRGGMGRVFAAVRDDDVRQEVALKLVRRDLLDPRLLRRFSTERQLLAALEHPGICRLIDTGELPDGTPYVVMERVRGRPLLEHCDAARLELRTRIRIFVAVLDAVSFAHRNLVVHRDIKPGNVMVDEAGRPKLLDFGIAKRLEAGEHVTLTTDRAFTLGYAAPEQIRGGAIGVGVDVYGLGALLYELLAGVPPFPGGKQSPGEIERRILEHPPPRMSDTVQRDDADRASARGLRHAAELRRALDGDLDLIVQRCLRKAPEQRYASVDLLQLDLQRWLDGHPISGRLGERGYRLRRFVGRHRLAVATAAVSTLLLLGAAAAIAVQSVDLRRQRDRLQLERDRAEQAIDFLQEAFSAADPTGFAGVELTARDMLDGADRELQGLQDRQPELHASLATTMGAVRLSLGDVSGALRLARAAKPPSALPEHDVLLARSLFEAGDWEAAEVVARDAAASGRSALELRLVRANVHVMRKEFSEALAQLEALRREVAELPVDDPLRNEVGLKLVNAHRAADQTPQAMAALDRLLAEQLAILPASHPLVQRSQLLRVTLLLRSGESDQALRLATLAVEETRKAYGASGTLYANALMTLGNALIVARRYEDATDTIRSALAAWRAALGPHHHKTLRTQFNLASLLLSDETGRAEGMPLLRDALEGARLRLGADDPLTAFFRHNLGERLLLEGKAGEALTVLTGPDAEAGLARSSQANRRAHLELAQEAAARLGCAPRNGAETPTQAQCLAVARLERFGTLPTPPLSAGQ